MFLVIGVRGFIDRIPNDKEFLIMMESRQLSGEAETLLNTAITKGNGMISHL